MVYKERFISPDQINEAILSVKDMAAREGFSAALAGGVAMQVYGSPRLTKDVDFVVDAIPSDPGSFRKTHPITFGGFSYLAPLGGKVDLIQRNDDYASLYSEALWSAVTTPDGVVVVSADHLAAMKFFAARDHDVLDLKWMLRQPGLVDVKKVAALVYKSMKQFGQERFLDFVDQTAVEDEMRKRREKSPDSE